MTAEHATREPSTRVPARSFREGRDGAARVRRAALRALVVPAAVAVTTAATGTGVAAAAPNNGVSHKSADDIVSTSIAATQSATSFTLNGAISQPGQSFAFKKVSMSQSGNAKGTLVLNGKALKVVVAGGIVYVNGSTGFWKTYAGSSVASQIGGKWVYGGQSNEGLSSFSSLLKPQSLTQKFFPSPKGSSFAKAGTTTVNGKKAIRINGAKGNSGGSLDVATTGNPYVLRVSVTTQGSGTLNFSGYNKPVETTPPPNPINFTQLQG